MAKLIDLMIAIINLFAALVQALTSLLG